MPEVLFQIHFLQTSVTNLLEAADVVTITLLIVYNGVILKKNKIPTTGLWNYQILLLQKVTFFLFLEENICCGFLSEVPWCGASNQYPQYMFSSRNEKNIYLIV